MYQSGVFSTVGILYTDVYVDFDDENSNSWPKKYLHVSDLNKVTSDVFPAGIKFFYLFQIDHLILFE